MLNFFYSRFLSASKHCYISVTVKEEDLFYYHSSVITLSKNYIVWETKNPSIDQIDRIFFFLYVCS